MTPSRKLIIITARRAPASSSFLSVTPSLFSLLWLVSHLLTNIMDKLVAQYTRPSHQDALFSEAEQQELTETTPPISLKFNLPPLDNVRFPLNLNLTDDGRPLADLVLS